VYFVDRRRFIHEIHEIRTRNIRKPETEKAVRMSHPPELSNLIADVKEQVLYLQELGVDTMSVDFPERTSSDVVVESSKLPVPVPAASVSVLKMETARKPPGSRLAALPSLAKRERSEPTQHLQSPQMMENPEVRSQAVSPVLSNTTADESLRTSSSDTIESIRAEIGPCTRCKLHTGRTQIVHTTGNFQADLMFVGEAPGADEDEQGFPFVGRAGQLLTKIIESIGMKREEVCIGNINRCRPPGNRQPEPDETAACRPFILREIAVVNPKVIVVLGATAAHNLLQIKTPISKLRGSFQDYFGVKVMPTFHPAYLLRDPHKKREVWEDMKTVRDYLNSVTG